MPVEIGVIDSVSKDRGSFVLSYRVGESNYGVFVRERETSKGDFVLASAGKPIVVISDDLGVVTDIDIDNQPIFKL